MKSRILILGLCFFCFWAVLILRAAQIQLIPDSRLLQLNKRQYETAVVLLPRRGDILDRNGNELATSIQTHSLFADPSLVLEKRGTSRALARILSLSARSIESKLKKSGRFVWIQRHLDQSTRDAVMELKLPGLGFVDESKRIYPNETMLAPVLGFVGEDGRGLEGLELHFNDQLQALKKTLSMRRDARGRPLVSNGQVFHQLDEGLNLYLTIDRDIQYQLDHELSQTLKEQDADSAIGVVLDAQTSEVLALSIYPTFDPNSPLSYKPALWRNRLISDAFEPGSVMKTFVVAESLAKGKIEPSSMIDCGNGEMRIGKNRIREAERNHRYSQLSVTDVLMHSSNVGASRLALDLGAHDLRFALARFGFGAKTGIDMPGEAIGKLHPLPWSEHLLANISFGHGLSATPLQIANAYAIIANGGFLRQPLILKNRVDRVTGESLPLTVPEEGRRVISEDVVEKMRLILSQVTRPEGTGRLAAIPGYPVAGKTGTAQKVDPDKRGYLKSAYISSFVGFVPANKPKFVIYIAVDHPRKNYYGSAVAAPIFSRIGSFAVRRAGLQPVFIATADVMKKNHFSRSEPDEIISKTGDNRLPELKGLTVREVMDELRPRGLRAKIIGTGLASSSSPEAGQVVQQGDSVTVQFTQ